MERLSTLRMKMLRSERALEIMNTPVKLKSYEQREQVERIIYDSAMITLMGARLPLGTFRRP